MQQLTALSCLKLRSFQNPFNKDKSVGLYMEVSIETSMVYKTYHAQKCLKFALVVEFAKLDFTYITVLKHQTKARPHRVE